MRRHLFVFVFSAASLRGPTTAVVRIANFSSATKAQRWQLSSTNGIERIGDIAVTGDAMTIDLAPQSITLIVVPSGVPPRRRAVR